VITTDILSGRRTDGPEAIAELASQALTTGEEESALPTIMAAAGRLRSALLWQWAGLLQRSLDEHAAAIRSFAEAARLAPKDAGIAHGQARVAMEAGLDAVGLFERARALAPQDGGVLIGLAASRMAVGQGERAAAELQAILDQAPSWIVGHEQLAQLLSTLGRKDEATDSIEKAIARDPRQEALWNALFGLYLRAERYADLEEGVARARKAGIKDETLAIYDAICASELNDDTFPTALFEGAAPNLNPFLGIWRIRHLLRVGSIDAALPIIDEELKTDRASVIWPYASLAWRLAVDERAEWLEGDDRFVSVTDLTPDLPPLDQLAATLRGLHVAKGEYLDQSVRGGTQTDGPLLSRIDPIIRQLRGAIVKAVQRYVDQLPPLDPRHPLLSQRRHRRLRFSGSWSVRLRSGGRHSNHVHPQGWISSALYISLPDHVPGEAQDAGWFTLGEPHDILGIDLPFNRKIEPKPGQLVLFPSWMWHGTLPFTEGERLTVAFDVRPPL
jgi:tetratricopeptide (TPR) repeat protein